MSEQLENSVSVIKQQIALMKKCLDQKNRLMDALKHCSTFLSELRTNALTPKQYYEMYILVFDGLSYLSSFLRDTHPNNHLADLYELVQYAGNIIPRLYLMITVGTVYMSIPNSPKKEIMKDMIEMCRGVQHPVRGLFLRYYLSQRTKDLLPVDDESLDDSIKFIITNFIEMNKLWVRLQHQGHSSERSKRTKERKELQILVGSNLVRLSQLEKIDKNYYKEFILPTILEQIVQCKDMIAQEYLLDVITQVFPDEFQVSTLEEFLSTTLALNDAVSLKKIVLALINRLIGFKQRESDLATTSNFLDVFIKYVENLDSLKPDLPLDDFFAILEGVCKICIIYHPEDYQNVNRIFQHALAKSKEHQGKPSDLILENYWKLLLLAPVLNYSSVKSILELDDTYFDFLTAQKPQLQSSVSMEVLDRLLDNNFKIETPGQVNKIFRYISTLLEEGNPTMKQLGLDPAQSIEVQKQQEKLAKFLHLLYSSDPFAHFELIRLSKTHLSKNSIRIQSTYPTLVSILLKIIRKLKLINYIDLENPTAVLQVKNVFRFISTTINELYQQSAENVPQSCVNLNLLAAQLANEVGLVDIAYEFFIESFIIYEESIVDSRLQYQVLLLIISKLHSCNNLITSSMENYDTLITKTALYGSKLLKKPDQCRAVYNASHLWWVIQQNEEEDDDETEEGEEPKPAPQIPLKKDNKRVLECLQKSLRIADSTLDTSASLELFVEILNRSLYYFIHGNELVTIKYINGLIELIQNNFNAMTSGNENETIRQEFNRTLQYIKEQGSIDERFQHIVLV
ncbi:unnamed protein product [Kuraishia capsulata CBS 1993]|uniref:Vacuolar protein sorting-associated protein 35 n=1 Tax=Kuraishia capsulata CBS 1993 TaxID=1382522 RepID=W6MIP6_9ASCO|nr:uncharacterized protein KUCA_T00001778001 [Kuraishia capsulata CBS 1993]CDK25808.1 unnamed protein product [Kuraishia capsulata CBS 1993]